MANIGANFNGQIFRKDFPIVIATNRASAVLLPVRLRYEANGYVAGQVLALNTTDGLYDKYNGSGSSGTNVAAGVLFESHPAEDFDSQNSAGTCLAVGIFGGCTLFKDRLTGWGSGPLGDLKAREITDASGVTTIKF